MQKLDIFNFGINGRGLIHLPGQDQFQCKVTHIWSLPAMQQKQKQRKSELLALVKWVHSSPL